MRQKNGRNKITKLSIIVIALLVSLALSFGACVKASSYAEPGAGQTVWNRNLQDAGDTEKRRSAMDIALVRDDGTRVLVKEGSVYDSNVGITFYFRDEGLRFEYSLSGDGGRSFSTYQAIGGNAYRLPVSESNTAEGLWYISFRGCDSYDDIVKESAVYQIRFDTKSPDVGVILKERKLLGKVRSVGINLKLADEKSGLKYAELRLDGEILYRDNFYGAEMAQKDKAYSLSQRAGDITGRSLKLYAMDRAGNESFAEQVYYPKAGGSLRPENLFPYQDLVSAKDKLNDETIFSGAVVLCFVLTGFLCEALVLCIRRRVV